MDLALKDLIPLAASLLDAGVPPHDLEGELKSLVGVLTRVYEGFEVKDSSKVTVPLSGKNAIEPGYSPEQLILREGILKRGMAYANLTPPTQTLLQLLLSKPGQLVTFAEIKEALNLDDHGVYVTAGALRKALETLGVTEPVLRNKRGEGYYWGVSQPVQVQIPQTV